MKNAKIAFIPSIPLRWDDLTKSYIPNINFNKAYKYADEVIIINQFQESPDAYAIDSAIRKIEETVKSSPQDYILIAAGNPVLIAAAALAAKRYKDWVDIYYWNRKKQDYDIITL